MANDSEKSGGTTTKVTIQNNTSNSLGLASFILGLISIFFLLPAFALPQQVDSLLNSSHETSWAYFRDPSLTYWYISHPNGKTYALGYNNSGHNSWVVLANDGAVANLDFLNKRISLSSSTATLTPSDSYLAISLVGGEASQYVYGNNANQWATLIAGKTVNPDWYFFRVESTQTWYIVPIAEKDSKILRLQLNAAMNQYDWQNPLDGSDPGVAVDTTTKLKKEFFQENNVWKVKFSIPDFNYATPTYAANPNRRGYCYPQCVEFIKENLGLPGGRLYAKEYWTNPHANYINYAQGSSTRAPRPGDILVWSGSLNPNIPAGVCPPEGCGHVAIVKSVNLHTGTLTRADANWGGRCAVIETEMTVTKNSNDEYTIGGAGSGHLLGWQSKDLTYFQ